MYSVISADQGSLMEQDVGTLYLNPKLLDHTRRTKIRERGVFVKNDCRTSFVQSSEINDLIRAHWSC